MRVSRAVGRAMLLSRITSVLTALTAIRDALARAEPSWVLLALGIYLVSVPVVASRWRVMIAGVTGTRVPLGPLVLATLASSFVNNVTPAARLSGEACRVIALVRMRAATTAQATAVAVYERLTEAPAFGALALAALVVVGRLSVTSITWGVVMLAFVVTLFVAAGRGWSRVTERWRDLGAVGVSRSALIATAALSGLVWLLDVARLAVVAAAFHAPITMLQAAALAAITILAGLVPTIGGLGAVEGGLVAGLVSFGVTPPDALAITIVERMMSYGIATVAGAGALSLLGGRSLWNAVRA